MISYVSQKLKSEPKVADTFIRQGEKEDDGLMSDGLMFDMFAYFKLSLNSIEKNTLIKELQEEGVLIPCKEGFWMKPR